jgi:threonine dehydrogenase-like Zn-dependent dehydrogenase
MQSWNWKGLDVINAHERQPAVYLEGLRWALDVVARYELDPSSLITHTWPLDQFGEALAAAESHPPGYVK